MKLFNVKHYSIVPPPYGGVSVFLSRLIKRLNKDGISSGAYYLRCNKDEQLIDSKLFDPFDWDKKMPRIIRLFKHIKRIIYASRRYEIIHIHGQEMICLWALAHMILRQKIVVTVHNSMLGEYYPMMSFLNRWGFKYLAKNDVQWIAVSEQAKNELFKLPVSFKKTIKVIPAYIPDLSDVSSLPSEMDSYILNHKKIIFFYGRSFMVHEGKDVYGFKTIIKLFHSIKSNVHFSVGLILCISETTDNDGIQQLQNYAKEFQVDHDIFWQIGGIEGIRPLWQRTDVYIRPTSTDGDSVAVRDALAEGAHVIASDVCDRPTGTIVYSYNNDEELFEKTIKALMQNRQDTINVDKYYLQMKSIYQTLLAE